MPDHIVIELEFLSYLYQEAGDVEIKRFIEDHLDWIPFLKESFEKAHAHPFYDQFDRDFSIFSFIEKRGDWRRRVMERRTFIQRLFEALALGGLFLLVGCERKGEASGFWESGKTLAIGE